MAIQLGISHRLDRSLVTQLMNHADIRNVRSYSSEMVKLNANHGQAGNLPIDQEIPRWNSGAQFDRK
jgi:hypothetical protein